MHIYYFEIETDETKLVATEKSQIFCIPFDSFARQVWIETMMFMIIIFALHCLKKIQIQLHGFYFIILAIKVFNGIFMRCDFACELLFNCLCVHYTRYVHTVSFSRETLLSVDKIYFVKLIRWEKCWENLSKMKYKKHCYPLNRSRISLHIWHKYKAYMNEFNVGRRSYEYYGWYTNLSLAVLVIRFAQCSCSTSNRKHCFPKHSLNYIWQICCKKRLPTKST